ncbi:MAG: MotA/TolQ/ExbB proton channel family protein [Deltaproteobacteria bacterium]|nr:MotA/TolQ/ExbB proton channel family protein [Deltaproteobacteria bacterium]
MLPLAVVSVWLWTLILVKLMEIGRYRRASRTGQAGWQGALVRDFMAQRTDRAGRNRELLKSLQVRHSARLERHVQTILILASIAPLIGLLGTVTGMITTFGVLAQHGTGNAKALAGGVSEALITTQSGLVVALPGLFMGNFIRRRVGRIKARLERFCLGLAQAQEI